MVKTISVHKARENFANILDIVSHNEAEVIIEKHGKPVAKIVSPDTYTTKTPIVRDLSNVYGLWNNTDGKKIEKGTKELRSKFKIKPSKL